MTAPLLLSCPCGAHYPPDARPTYAHFFSIGSGTRDWTPEEGLCPGCWDKMALRWINAKDIVELAPDGSPTTPAEALRLSSVHPAAMRARPTRVRGKSDD